MPWVVLGAFVSTAIGSYAIPRATNVLLVCGFIVATLLAFRCAARSHGRSRKVWWLLAYGTLGSLIGFVIDLVGFVLNANVEAQRVSDPFFAITVPLGATALWLLVRAFDPRGARDELLDGAAVAIGSALIIWQFVVVNTVHASATPGEIIAASFPMLNVVYIVPVMALLFIPRRPNMAVTFVITAFIFAIVSSLTYWIADARGANGDESAGPWFILAGGLLATAALHRGGPLVAISTDTGDERRKRAIHVGRLIAFGTMLAIPPVLAAYTDAIGERLDWWAYVGVAIFVSVIVVFRFGQLLTRALADRQLAEEAEDRLAHQASHDVLTTLPNRALLIDRLEQTLARMHRHPSTLAILFCDLDRFKGVNDSLGHSAGDELLRQVATRFRQVVRTGDTVARLGGDEFVILCEEIEDELVALDVAERMLEVLKPPFVLEDRESFVTASIGVTISSDANAIPDQLLQDADIALYQAKEAGRNRIERFDSQMRRWASQRHDLENALRHAVDRNELHVVYQPQIELVNETVVGFEALMRWERPTGGIVSPEVFIEVAEATGVIVQIGEWVLREACSQLASWNREYAFDVLPLRMAVNISARQLAHHNLVEMVSTALELSGIDPSWLELELTETFLVKDPDLGVRRMEALRALGVRLAIDDFGTGYSSFTYLRRLPVDSIKLDMSFVSEIGMYRKESSVVAAIIAMAHSLGHRVTAEGVETELQARALRALGCDAAQGYYFSRPLGLAEAERMLRAQSHDKVLREGHWVPNEVSSGS